MFECSKTKFCFSTCVKRHSCYEVSRKMKILWFRSKIKYLHFNLSDSRRLRWRSELENYPILKNLGFSSLIDSQGLRKPRNVYKWTWYKKCARKYFTKNSPLEKSWNCTHRHVNRCLERCQKYYSITFHDWTNFEQLKVFTNFFLRFFSRSIVMIIYQILHSNNFNVPSEKTRAEEKLLSSEMIEITSEHFLFIYLIALHATSHQQNVLLLAFVQILLSSISFIEYFVYGIRKRRNLYAESWDVLVHSSTYVLFPSNKSMMWLRDNVGFRCYSESTQIFLSVIAIYLRYPFRSK